MATLLPRRVVGLLTTFLLAVVTVGSLAAPAQAEDGYQYWNYFHLHNGTWAFSKVGLGDYQPKDGDVEGLRYGTSTASQGIEPRADLTKVTFDTVCADTKPAQGKKRVAILLDFGTETGAGTPPEPRAECAVGPEQASSQQLLARVADLRLESGMTCAIDGYPVKGCGTPVKNAQVPAHEQPVAFALPSDDAATTDGTEGDNGIPWAPIGIGAVVVVLAGGALLMSRRSKTA